MESALQEAYGEVAHVRPPVVLGADPIEKLVLEGAQAQKEVLSLPDNRAVAAQLAGHADKLVGVEGAAAVVTLVAARTVEPAVRALSLDVAVGQEPAVRLAVGLHHRVLLDVALLVEGQEHVLGDRSVVVGVSGREEVEVDTQALPVVEELGLILLEHLLGTHTALLSGQRYRCAVGVAPGDHQDVVALEAVVSGEDVGWQVAACDLSEVYGSVGVGPRYSYENALGHVRYMVSQWAPIRGGGTGRPAWVWVVRGYVRGAHPACR